MLSSPRNSVTHNQQAKLAIDYTELLKELSSHEITSVGCYTIGETIGQGTYGKVKKGFHKLTGKVVAIKKISKQHAAMMAREIHHHRQLKHPNIVMLYEMITTESAIHIISEYCSNGDLLDALTKEPTGRCSEPKVRRWCQQLADAIKYCHTRGIVHRDLKLENILLDSNDNAKICDFGFARFAQKNQFLETFCGSLSYSAPEVILCKKYRGPECDVWSLGVILYTLLAGEYPFDDDSDVVTQRKIVAVDYVIPFYFSADLSDLITNMLQLVPSNRLTIDAILNHPWTTASTIVDDDEEPQEETEAHSDESSLEEEETCVTPSTSTTTADLVVAAEMNTILTEKNRSLDTPTSDPINKPIANDSALPDTIIKFSPHVRSSLGITLRPSQSLQQQQQQQQKSPRFSAPTSLSSPHQQSTLYSYTILHNHHSQQPPYRTSLPSSFHKTSKYLHYDTITSHQHELPAMTPVEQRLFAALTAAGFDKDALIKMQSGQCDTSSTLWHILLENMSKNPSITSGQGSQSVPDAFVSAIQSRNQNMLLSLASFGEAAKKQSSATHPCFRPFDFTTTTPTNKTGIDRGIQTSSIEDNEIGVVNCNDDGSLKKPRETATSYLKSYPRPPTSASQQKIETVGFGSPVLPKHSLHSPSSTTYGKPSWLSSVKSWFGSPTLAYNTNTVGQQQQRHCSSTNCSTVSSPIASPSSYRNFDTTVQSNDASRIISSPIYRNGGSLSSQQQQKYRRRALQLSTPPTGEIDKMAFISVGVSAPTTSKRFSRRLSTASNSSKRTSSATGRITTNYSNNITYQQYISDIASVDNMLLMPRPTTAFMSPSTKDANFSILTDTAELQEIDMLTAKRYPSSSILCHDANNFCERRDPIYDSVSSYSSNSDSTSSDSIDDDVEEAANDRNSLPVHTQQSEQFDCTLDSSTSFTFGNESNAAPLQINESVSMLSQEEQRLKEEPFTSIITTTTTMTDNTTSVPNSLPMNSTTAAEPFVKNTDNDVESELESIVLPKGEEKKQTSNNHSRLTEVLEMKKTSTSNRKLIKPLTLSEKAMLPGAPSSSLSSPTTSLFSPRSSRFEFTPRSRLSVYGMQESRSTPMTSKIIVEEEEEEEEI
ncbi:kinase-like domain-containing protein [Mycotypha africana]|uniref:kinase-like domain-containing protein n=1 Tax=Mycotypha africana TaxID=64632 RepID=UPI002301D8ED|nr:kinase-like domain-containing protein [Mycotypha africana]KAI8982214.1 kinase-like domain-containing protein [Mycotypha africana]